MTTTGEDDAMVQVTRVHDRPEIAGRFDGKLVGAFVRARKPDGVTVRG